ncbi:trimethyllysine dioxygenase [Capronia epimyces CBS 606.96]|uniref:Trimethyllysine dioxygenase n=1 Tax=Capronia epimyces CBS 606.96 TaxID=1182542 RepID=W9Y2I7_9EURO|nr:trimethyllysine dioxygenase [Capronia epimyces CBS 606.96]EXJ86723.1 trimethyllysine dioxygenase [Capronia epimyces CBS 606.96]
MANQEVIVDFNTGTALRYPSFWLRDHCPCSECQHPSTHQRQLDTFTIDPEIKVSSVRSTPSGLEVVWPNSSSRDSSSHENANANANTSTNTNKTHTSVYPWEWLETHPPFVQASKKTPATAAAVQRAWTHVAPSAAPTNLPRVAYSAIVDGPDTDGLKRFLQHIHTYGLCFVPGTPANPAATQTLVERIAHIRATHYGGFWDFTSEANPIDTAYTNDPLPPHTDTTYFTDPAGLQLFHLLSHTSLQDPSRAGQGGESTFVDGFAAAAHLYHHFPDHYRALATYPITSAALGSPAGAFLNTNAALQGYPVLNHSSPSASRVAAPSPATLVQIRWNNLDRLAPATPTFPNHTALKAWYAAAREWARILESPEFLLTVKLQPGEPVIFDNWRVLHGRLAFEGKRRVCGAYTAMDDFSAKCRSLAIEV